jgi:phosphomannomutase
MLNGVPNPLLPETREATAKAVRESGADAGVAWDGDFDRSFMFEEQGKVIEGYYMVGFLAKAFLQKNAGEKIIYDLLLTWNTEELVKESGGVSIISKNGMPLSRRRCGRLMPFMWRGNECPSLFP